MNRDEFMCSFALDNDAFTENPNGEIARVLRGLADRIDSEPSVLPHGEKFPLRDINGNSIGMARVLNVEYDYQHELAV